MTYRFIHPATNERTISIKTMTGDLVQLEIERDDTIFSLKKFISTHPRLFGVESAPIQRISLTHIKESGDFVDFDQYSNISIAGEYIDNHTSYESLRNEGLVLNLVIRDRDSMTDLEMYKKTMASVQIQDEEGHSFAIAGSLHMATDIATAIFNGDRMELDRLRQTCEIEFFDLVKYYTWDEINSKWINKSPDSGFYYIHSVYDRNR